MKSLIGTWALATASWAVSFSARYGCKASWFTRSNTGAMMNRVRNSAMPVRIWFDGVCCRPRA
ncbi:hypothetical protein D3C87_2170950 [compost metagenome]